jgi:hypothetical protein
MLLFAIVIMTKPTPASAFTVVTKRMLQNKSLEQRLA